MSGNIPTDRLIHTVTEDEDGKQLSSVLRSDFQIASSMVKLLKRNGGLLVNGKISRTIDIVKENDIVTVLLNVDDKKPDILPVKMTLNILYEDDAIIAIDKPENMVVHTTCLHQNDTLSNGLAYYMRKKRINGVIHPVIRLDRDTSGVVLFAKNAYIQESLKRQFRTDLCRKIYIGLVSPVPEYDEGIIELPIKRQDESIMLRTVSDDGSYARTDYKVIKKYSNEIALLEFRLYTGRTHQIRVHSKHSGFPLVGDEMYGGRMDANIKTVGQALHAKSISFIHPITRKKIMIQAKDPEWLD